MILARKLLTGRDLGRLRRAARILIYDFDDAVMYRSAERSNPVSLIRRARFRKVIRAADAVIAGNRILADEARPDTDAPVYVIPTAVDTERVRPVVRRDRAGLCVGWLGSKGSIRQFDLLADTWREIVRRSAGAIGLRVVSDVCPECAGRGIEHVRWSPEAESAGLASFDIGVMPLVDHPFTRGKCAFKILQYFAAGLSAVASPVGMNTEVIRPGETGFLAASADDWITHIETLAADGDLRKKLGRNARVLVEEQFDVKKIARRLADVIMKTVAREAVE